MVGRTSAKWRPDGVLDGGAEDKGRQRRACGFGLGGGGLAGSDGRVPSRATAPQARAVEGLAFRSGEELSPTLHPWGTAQG